MASEKIMKFVEDIKTLSVLELAELVDAIQEEFGVTARLVPPVEFFFPSCGGVSAFFLFILSRRRLLSMGSRHFCSLYIIFINSVLSVHLPCSSQSVLPHKIHFRLTVIQYRFPSLHKISLSIPLSFKTLHTAKSLSIFTALSTFS